MKATDIKEENSPLTILIHSPAGGGKTALVSQASNGYLFDFDDGMRTAKNLEDKFTSLRHSIEFDSYRDKDPRKPKAWLSAKKKIFELRRLFDKKECPYNAIVIDGITWMG